MDYVVELCPEQAIIDTLADATGKRVYRMPIGEQLKA